tara:strand:- start:42661 stop:43155 length:495 start_codon:yes stop_codon:yes gene_type:complete
MGYYNAVLLPDVAFRDRIVDYAQDKYSDISDGYCLSHNVYPHITLCQFEADEQPMIFIEELFNPVFTEASIREGKGSHVGFSWIEWVVKKDNWLVKLQETVRGALESEGINVEAAKGSHYYPHMTFCRTPKEKAGNIPLAMIEQSDKPWIFTVGCSDKNGQFLG